MSGHKAATVDEAETLIAGVNFGRCPCGNRVGGGAQVSHTTADHFGFKKYCTEVDCEGAIASVPRAD